MPITRPTPQPTGSSPSACRANALPGRFPALVERMRHSRKAPRPGSRLNTTAIQPFNQESQP
jgi:hypothetical protein